MSSVPVIAYNDDQNSLYNHDFYAWTQEQAALLKAGRLNAVDVTNLIEEIEALGRSEKRELSSRLRQLLMHLLKWRYQPDLRSKSWQATIREQQRQLQDLLEDSPSLKTSLPEKISACHDMARTDAADETGIFLANFPEVCPFSQEQILANDYWPEP